VTGTLPLPQVVMGFHQTQACMQASALPISHRLLTAGGQGALRPLYLAAWRVVWSSGRRSCVPVGLVGMAQPAQAGPARRRQRSGAHAAGCAWQRCRPPRCRPGCCACCGCDERRHLERTPPGSCLRRLPCGWRPGGHPGSGWGHGELTLHAVVAQQNVQHTLCHVGVPGSCKHACQW
jgi:hypothetical protein